MTPVPKGQGEREVVPECAVWPELWLYLERKQKLPDWVGKGKR